MSNPFEGANDYGLITARVLLLNFGNRMLRGLKNQTTADEHKAILLCVAVIEKELTNRGIAIEDSSEDGEKDAR